MGDRVFLLCMGYLTPEMLRLAALLVDTAFLQSGQQAVNHPDLQVGATNCAVCDDVR